MSDLDPPGLGAGSSTFNPLGAGTASADLEELDLLRSRRARFVRTPRAAVAASAASTAVAVVLLGLVVFLAPGSAKFRNGFFDLHDMWESLKGDPRAGYYSVLRAIVVNIEMFCIAEVLILVVALVVALVRLSRSPVLFPLRIVAVAYVDFFRGVPLIMVVYAIGFGVPALELGFLSNQSAFVYGVASLVLAYGAYVSEVYRAGIFSVHLGQVAAARSLGLRPRTAMRHVVLPQAIRTIIPPLLNDFIGLQKDTALVAVLGTVIEANRAAQVYSSYAFNFSSYTVAAILFLLLTIPLARFTDHLIARDRRRRLAGFAT